MNKIDFALVIVAERCNPNGDPIHNMPRQDFEGYGEMSDVCLKRKIRNRMQDMGKSILIKSKDRIDDGYNNIRSRIEGNSPLKEMAKEKNFAPENYIKIVCASWDDVRYFGQIFPFKNAASVSVSVKGPVSIQIARTIDTVIVKGMQITKSTNLEAGGRNDSATMGMRYIIDKGVYVTYGSIYPQLAAATGFTQDDAETLKQCLLTLFENDASASRPSGSISVAELYWWEHNCASGQYAPIKVHRSVEFEPIDEFPYFKSSVHPLDGLEPEIYRLI